MPLPVATHALLSFLWSTGGTLRRNVVRSISLPGGGISHCERSPPATVAPLATLCLWSSRSSERSRRTLLKLGFSIDVEFNVLTHGARPSPRYAKGRRPAPCYPPRDLASIGQCAGVGTLAFH